ncbi:MAG: DTW domain-containing protein [Oligoflexia bacterium]|nr:DTW domain-containing protein [Oligoflexia bacterium]
MDPCARCQKPADLCVCEAIHPQESRIHVLILQHPQEPDKDLGSARLANLCLPNSTLKVGLSWPNLSKALGKEAQPSRWAVLHLGSGLKPAGASARPAPGLHFVTRQGAPVPASERPPIDGLVILDGTWSQAKTLWWRNAWLLKLKRAVLIPSRPSLYKELRREPRRECLSTIESIAESLTALGEPAPVSDELRRIFGLLLDKRRARKKAPAT